MNLTCSHEHLEVFKIQRELQRGDNFGHVPLILLARLDSTTDVHYEPTIR